MCLPASHFARKSFIVSFIVTGMVSAFIAGNTQSAQISTYINMFSPSDFNGKSVDLLVMNCIAGHNRSDYLVVDIKQQ